MPEGLLLLRSKIVQAILHLPVLGHVLEDMPWLHEILVHLREIAQDDPSPENELIQRLGIGVEGLVAIVEGEHRSHPVGRAQTAQPGKEIIDGNALRSDDGPSFHGGKVPEVFHEEAYSPLVWKNKTHPADFGSRMVIFCNLKEEGRHRRSVIIQSLSYLLISTWNSDRSPDATALRKMVALQCTSSGIPCMLIVNEILVPSMARLLTF